MLPAVTAVLGSSIGRMAIVGVVAFSTGAWLAYDMCEDSHEIRRLTHQIVALQQQYELEEVARSVAEARLAKASEEAAEYRGLLSRIEEASDEDDDAIGPLLRSVLGSLRENHDGSGDAEDPQ